MARAGLVSALGGRPEAWGTILPTLFLAANWALVRSLHHEYASALVVTAASVRAAFRSGDAARNDAAFLQAESAERAELVTRSENADVRGSGAPEPAPRAFPSQPPPDLARSPHPLTAHLRRGGADREECLIAAAECALTAAELYDRLDVPTKGWQARMLAAECYRFCEAPEDCALSIRWLSLAHNHAVLRGRDAPLAEHARHVETACAAWRAVAETAYKGTAGEDPGAFLSRAMINRYGVGLWQLFGGSLAVEMRDDAGRVKNGAAFARLLALGRDAGVPALGRPEDEALLELDCGYGRDAIAAAREGFRTVTGIDRMEYCIRHARRSIEDHRALAARVSFVRADPTGPDLPWKESFYGVVLARDVLTRVTDKARILARARTALRPGGALLLTEWVQARPTSHATWSTLCDTAWVTDLSTREGYERLLASAGFAVEAALERPEDLHAFFAGGAALATRMGAMDPTLDPAALERAQSDLRLLADLSAPEGPLGWVLMVARRV
jgi:SAM-dependent methyltransferase